MTKPSTNQTISRKRAAEIIRSLLSAGRPLSNIAHNLAQRSDLPKEVRDSCDRQRKEWDAVVGQLPKWVRKV